MSLCIQIKPLQALAWYASDLSFIIICLESESLRLANHYILETKSCSTGKSLVKTGMPRARSGQEEESRLKISHGIRDSGLH